MEVTRTPTTLWPKPRAEAGSGRSSRRRTKDSVCWPQGRSHDQEGPGTNEDGQATSPQRAQRSGLTILALLVFSLSMPTWTVLSKRKTDRRSLANALLHFLTTKHLAFSTSLEFRNLLKSLLDFLHLSNTRVFPPTSCPRFTSAVHSGWSSQPVWRLNHA